MTLAKLEQQSVPLRIGDQIERFRKNIVNIAGRVYRRLDHDRADLVISTAQEISNIFSPDATANVTMDQVNENPSPQELRSWEKIRYNNTVVNRALHNERTGELASILARMTSPKVLVPAGVVLSSSACAGVAAEVPIAAVQSQAQIIDVQEDVSSIGGQLPEQVGTAAALPVVVNTPRPTETRRPTPKATSTPRPIPEATPTPTSTITREPTVPPFTSAEARSVLGIESDSLIVGTECAKLDENNEPIEDKKCEIALAAGIKLGANTVPWWLAVVGNDTQWALGGKNPSLSVGPNGERVINLELQLLKMNPKLSLQPGSNAQITVDENGEFYVVVKVIAHAGQPHFYRTKLNPTDSVQNAAEGLDDVLDEMFEDVGTTYDPSGTSGAKFHGRGN